MSAWIEGDRIVYGHKEQTGGCQRVDAVDWEFGISRCKVLHIDWINNKVLLYSTGNYTQYLVINHNEKEYVKENMYMHIYIYVGMYESCRIIL